MDHPIFFIWCILGAVSGPLATLAIYKKAMAEFPQDPGWGDYIIFWILAFFTGIMGGAGMGPLIAIPILLGGMKGMYGK